MLSHISKSHNYAVDNHSGLRIVTLGWDKGKCNDAEVADVGGLHSTADLNFLFFSNNARQNFKDKSGIEQICHLKYLLINQKSKTKIYIQLSDNTKYIYKA